MILLLLYFFSLITPLSAETVDIHSPRYTQYGDWRGWKQCPDGMFAFGAQIKVEGDQRGRDDTGLNAVALYCNRLNWVSYNNEHWIMSGEGDWGEWKGIKYCPEGQVIIGFALRSEPDQHGRDDVAADNFAAYCGTLDGPRDRSSWFQGDTPGWGEWTDDQFCPKGFAVCGINSQIEGDRGGGDDTALNNVDLRCCRGPRVGLSCTPQYSLERLTEYDNRQGAGTITIQYEKRISFTKTSGTTTTVGKEEKEAVLSKVTTGLEISAQGAYKGITGTGTGSVGYEHSTNRETISTNQIQTMVQNAMTEEKTVTETYNVPAYQGVIIEQLFMSCGDIKTVTADLYRRQLDHVNEALGRQGVDTTSTKLLHDSPRSHVAKITAQKIQKLGWEVLPHAPYSPDTALSDFNSFRSMQHSLADRHFKNHDEVEKWVR
uniref:C-type lectin domain-containing protein n=1 Tax=Caenorhabditis tropicalis TaxID=1561998 RepID=A0A1I7TPN3_9PELO